MRMTWQKKTNPYRQHVNIMFKYINIYVGCQFTNLSVDNHICAKTSAYRTRIFSLLYL